MTAPRPIARLLNGRPLAEDDWDGLRVLERRLVGDLGVKLQALHDWIATRPDLAGMVTLSEAGTTVLALEPGRRSDGSSEPWFVHPIMGDPKKRAAAAWFHDGLYAEGAPRAESDLAYWIIAGSGPEEHRVGPVRCWLGWVGVRAGGWWAYWKHERRRRAA